MKAEEALGLVTQILDSKQLSYIQEVIFLHSWNGKLYREIALESGYDLDYVKEVGSQLWNALSAVTGEKVTKKNVHLVVTALSEKLQNLRPTNLLSPSPRSPLQFPTGPVSQQSNLYIARPPIEERAFTEVIRPGSLIRIRAPRQMGKTSLLYRLIMHAQSNKVATVMVNLQQVDSDIFHSLNRFLRWFCLNVEEQLQLESKLDDFWSHERGSKISSTLYFQSHFLELLDHPLLLVLDEVNQIFEYPELAKDFLALLCSWHEQAATGATWQKLRIVIAYSIESHISLNIKKSLFDLGLPISLPGFGLEQVQDLIKRHRFENTEITRVELENFIQLVGGNPYLIRLGLYYLHQENISLAQLCRDPSIAQRIYDDHLRQKWLMLQNQPSLLEALQRILTKADGVRLEGTVAYHLESMGLIRLEGIWATIACQLYQSFFAAQLQPKD